MTVESTADQINFLRDFGTVASVSGSSTTTVTGIYEQQHIEVDDNGGMQYSTNTSSFYIRSADAATIPRNTIVLHDGTYFTIADLQKQQEGIFTLALLRKA